MGQRPTAAVWDRTWASSRYGIDPMTRTIAAELFNTVPVAGRTVLELGCGSGRLSYLAKLAGATQVTLVDFSEAALRRAEGLMAGLPNVTFINADLTTLELPRRFDVVFSSGVVEHFRGSQLDDCIRAHVTNSKDHVAIIVPTTPHLNSVRCRLPWIVRKYGWQRPMRLRPLKPLLARHGANVLVARRFYALYGVPLLGNCPGFLRATRVFDNWFGGLLLVAGRVVHSKDRT